ncbi:hypothetical protein MSG28_010140 [Choristoneura fumiferana]|uniref:Uncharacterized protein n=1 Tax=Choristoneura fumiferana TaxID=7141 RepID=A0ACC0KJF1_CHOFU|nr:hypothetical protein MSG28_010140 [Choristoneura fumiferana]
MAACWADLPHSTRGVILGPLRIQVNCVVLGYLSLLLIVQLAVTSTETVTKYKMALIAMTFNLPEMIQFTQLAFYFIMMKMIIAIMKKIEENFAMIAHMRMVRRMGNDYVGLKIGSSLESLRRVRGVYARTLAVKRQVNAAFQGPLLFTLAQGYHSIICDAHILYHGIIFQDDFTIHDVIEQCFWISYQLIKFHILGYASALIKLQVNKIGRSLYDISAYINDDITQYKSSADLNDEITLHLEPVEELKEVKVQPVEEEMMETAAGFAPLPGFMIRRLKERRQQTQAQRRYGPTVVGRGYQRKPPCPQNRYHGEQSNVVVDDQRDRGARTYPHHFRRQTFV